ncbi:hypothetical protein J2B92_19400 [Lysinibacillus sphaericus]|uniref:Swt1 family HEPN domain-containing protein n=2 Tax=Lysinibacillus TaxID=400634 RepID=UPI0019D5453A|nr:Swt1 family HEPN domain-containing protein [Lysinibacillus sphaericus]QTB12938.1 hypothetical protein J2B92_19400 [Lysinibacillus sphaericus]
MILASLTSLYKNIKEKQIHHLVLSHGDIQELSLNGKCLSFKYLDQELKQTVNINNDTFGNNVVKLTLEGSFDAVESFRGTYFNLMKQCATKRYVIKDEISLKLCEQGYPYINKVENLLRQYIMNFMILKVGDEWWELNVNDSEKEKSGKRSEKAAFGNLINQDIYHIDFKDLLSFIYDNFSAFKNKNEVLNRLKECSSLEEFNNLKRSVMSNKEKFFDGIFDGNFKNKWEELAEIRNLIAHNKLFEKKQLDKVIELSGELESVLNSAIAELQSYEVSEEESEAYRGTIQQERNTIVVSNLLKLKSEYNIDMDQIKEAIQTISQPGEEKQEEYFTLVELVEKLTDKNYSVKEPINSYLGYILGNSKDELFLEKGAQRITYVDESGTMTTLATWKYVPHQEDV